jgi:membrane protein
VRQGGFRWVSPGAVLAVAIWLVASGGFALYVTHFGAYNKTYGSVAAVIVFLVWLWISNLAFLLGAEYDSEVQRGRAIQAGHPPDAEPYLQLRDAGRVDLVEETDLT